MRRRPGAAARGLFLGTCLVLAGTTSAIAQSQGTRPSFMGHLGAFVFRDLPKDSPLTRIDRKAQVACSDLRPLGPSVVQSAVLVPRSAEMPEHCLVTGTLPTEIGFAVRLPLAWNGRLYMFGNGGFAGEDPVTAYRKPVERALGRGFLTVQTDTGHRIGGDPGVFYQDPVKMKNHAYLAVHKTVIYAKAMADAFYGARPKFSYWDGCSTGGREGVMEASRYPEDFDGVSAAAPTLMWSAVMLKGAWNQLQVENSGLDAGKFQTLFNEVMRQCDGLDGVKDGLIADPRACHVDLKKVPTCPTGQDTDQCLTPDQKERIARIYQGPPKVAGVPPWLSQLPGVEDPSIAALWILPLPGAPTNLLGMFADTWMRNVAFQNPNYRWKQSFNFERDPPQLTRFDDELNPSPDLAAFAKRGGKMITWWGWSDAGLNPQMGIDYYDKVVRKTGGLTQTQKFYRLFFVPGVAHCSGGYGPDGIDPLTPLMEWVELGRPPERLPARTDDGKYDRAYCPYPAATVYKGAGGTEDPRNYRCVARRAGEAAAKAGPA